MWLRAKSWQHFLSLFIGPYQLHKCGKQSVSGAHQDAGRAKIMSSTIGQRIGIGDMLHKEFANQSETAA